MSNFDYKLKSFLHDPVDKCFDILTHIERAKNYAERVGVSGIEDMQGPDMIASCMERSLLPKDVQQDFAEIRHPLSDEKIEISKFNKEEIFRVIEEVFAEAGSGIISNGDKIKFLYLWRNLQSLIFEKAKDKPWIKYLFLFPADTRFPDHSIWEHLKIASAINAFWDTENRKLIQNNSLFLFSIGPVQSFISQARKTQDFFMGSFILSYLTFIGIKEIINEYGPTSIIYPDLYNQPLMDWFLGNEMKIEVIKSYSDCIDMPTIPNRFVAIIPETDVEKIKNLANNIKSNVDEVVKNAMDSICKKLGLNSENAQTAMKGHSKDFPQIYWVSLPWRIGDNDTGIDDLKDFFIGDELKKWRDLLAFGNKEGEYPPNIGLLYQLFYAALEKSMGARKNLREFERIEESGRKCSLCGERNVLFFNEKENKGKFQRYNPEALDLTGKINPKFLSNGEGLCGLCFLKRTFDVYLENVSEKFKDFSFPSTAEIATADFKDRALKEARDEFKKYEDALRNFLKDKCPVVSFLPRLQNTTGTKETVEGEWFFEENLREEYIKKELRIDLGEKEIDKLKELLENLTKKVGKPLPYYAVLHLDGDNMGKRLSGELLPDIEYAYNSEVWNRGLSEDFKDNLKNKFDKKLLTPAIHASISNALRNFSIEFVKKIVEEEHLGKVVYAGGDDVLAFVNLKDLIDVMGKLRFAFSGEIEIKDGKVVVYMQNQSGFVEKDGMLILSMGKNASASMGVVIAHYKEPLKIVLNKVFEAEKKAKSVDKKDAFSIFLIKKSGKERIATFKWRYNSLLTTELIKKAKNAMNPDAERYISHNFIQKLKREFLRLKDEDGHLPVAEEIFDKESLRLISRAYNCKIKDDKNKKEFVDNYYNAIKELFWRSGGNIDNFANLLEIASFLNGSD